MRTLFAVTILALVATPALAAPETVTKTGQLDMELVSKTDGTFVVRDAAYAITFPQKPELEAGQQAAQDDAHTILKTLQVSYNNDTDVYAMFLIPVPKKIAYNGDVGMTASRDGALANVNGTIVHESMEKIGGLTFRHTIAHADYSGVSMRMDLYITWDAKHHTLVGYFTGGLAKEQTPAQLAFARSFVMNPAGMAPPAGTGK
jgi:hypothetical protein